MYVCGCGIRTAVSLGGSVNSITGTPCIAARQNLLRKVVRVVLHEFRMSWRPHYLSVVFNCFLSFPFSLILERTTGETLWFSSTGFPPLSCIFV